ncbi:hypothetical protein HQ563_17825 [bacterium]|nr:hypothetical protein [bacterium]
MKPRNAARFYVIPCVLLAGPLLPLSDAAEEYSFVKLWPEIPDGWYFNGLEALAVDDSGNVYVVDLHNHRIQKFRRSFGAKGVEDDTNSPTIGRDSEPGKIHKVWVAGPISSLISWVTVPGTISASGTGITSWTDDGFHPLGPAAGAIGRFYRIERLP